MKAVVCKPGRRCQALRGRPARGLFLPRGHSWRPRGELIVEAAYLVPWIVILTALLIVMTYYVHNVNWYRMAGYEAALLGNGRYETLGEAQGEADARARERAEQQTLPGTAPQAEVSCSRAGTTVRYSGQRLPAFQKAFVWEEKVTVVKVRPVEKLRLAHAPRKLVDK